MGLRAGGVDSQDSFLKEHVGCHPPQGLWQLPWVQAKELSLHFNLQLTPGPMPKKGDSWDCHIWVPEEVLPRLWSSHISFHDSHCSAFSSHVPRAVGTRPSLQYSTEKDLQPSLSRQNDTPARQRSLNAAVLLGITRRDGSRVDVLYFGFPSLMTTSLYHEVDELEGGLF